jgi:hypothetical protein
VLRAKYFHQGNLLDMALALEASNTWRAIDYGVEFLRCGAIYRVGDGESIRIWRDNWIPRPPSLKPSGSRKTCRLRGVSQLMREGTNDWDEAKIRRFFQPWDVEEILKIKIPTCKGPDIIAWHFERSGVFSVHSANRLVLARATNLDGEGGSSAPGGDRAVWRKLWKLQVPPKVRNFLWKFIKNGLPTNTNRYYRHLSSDGACEMCHHVNEDGFHAIMDCPHAKGLRHAMRRVWCLPPEGRLHDEGPEWFLVLLDSWRMEEVALLAMIMWRAWLVTNKVTRAGEVLSIDDNTEFLQRFMNQYQAANEPKVRSAEVQECVCPGWTS